MDLYNQKNNTYLKLIHTDCMGKRGLLSIPSHSIDLILTDLPYGATSAKWDSVIPIKPLFKQYKRIIKNHGCIALFGTGLFTARLQLLGNRFVPFRYHWVWRKPKATDFVNAHRMPLSDNEDISIFYKHLPTYHPQMIKGKTHSIGHRKRKKLSYSTTFQLNPKLHYSKYRTTNLYFPKKIITFKNVSYSGHKKFHPTQKPINLLEYLIKTYTNKGNLVLDNTMGSGSTGVACTLTNRNFIGMELDKHYYQVAVKRLLAIKNVDKAYKVVTTDHQLPLKSLKQHNY